MYGPCITNRLKGSQNNGDTFDCQMQEEHKEVRDIPLNAYPDTVFSPAMGSQGPTYGQNSSKVQKVHVSQETPNKHHQMSSLVIKRTKPLPPQITKNISITIFSLVFSMLPYLINKFFIQILVAIICLEKTWTVDMIQRKGNVKQQQLVRVINMPEKKHFSIWPG